MDNENYESNESISESNESSNSNEKFSLRAESDKLTASSETNDSATQGNSTEGQRENDPNKTGEQKELSPEEMMNSLLGEKAENGQINNELISQLNALGFVHNGQPFELKNAEEIRELVQKGRDYTQKTMAHAEEVKAKTEHFAQLEKQFVEKEQHIETQVYENKIVEDILLDAKENDPELFNLIASLYNRKVSEFQRQQPMMKKYDQTINQLKTEIEGIKGQRQGDELGKIKQGFQAEMSDVQTKLAPQFSKLGVGVDWAKVQDAWKADASGSLTVEQAVYAIHGKEIANAYNSYKKLLETKNKVQSSTLNRNSARGVGSSEETIRAKKPGDIMSILKQASASM